MSVEAMNAGFGSLAAAHEHADRFAGLTPAQLLREEQQSVVALALRVLEARQLTGELITSPESVKAYLRLRLSDEPREVFGALFLTTHHQLIGDEVLFNGTVDGASVHPRILVQRALIHNAAAVVVYHNHPSGHCEPSQADRQITQRLKEALDLIEVRVLDHLVVAQGGSCSLAERGWV